MFHDCICVATMMIIKWRFSLSYHFSLITEAACLNNWMFSILTYFSHWLSAKNVMLRSQLLSSLCCHLSSTVFIAEYLPTAVNFSPYVGLSCSRATTELSATFIANGKLAAQQKFPPQRPEKWHNKKPAVSHFLPRACFRTRITLIFQGHCWNNWRKLANDHMKAFWSKQDHCHNLIVTSS